MVHGLNTLAQRMDPLGQWLQSQHIEVLRVSLRGHGALPEQRLSEYATQRERLQVFKQANFNVWLDELKESYRKARKRADELQVPLYFVGYSMGALLGNNLLNRPSLQASFDKMILFAPALEITPFANLLRPLFKFPRLALPSVTPIDYRANTKTPMVAYRGLFEAYYEVHRTQFHGSRIPTLVFSDIHDEFVPYTKLARLVKKYKLDWELYPLHQKGTGKRRYFHLIIDEASVGTDLWLEMTDKMKTFLET